MTTDVAQGPRHGVAVAAQGLLLAMMLGACADIQPNSDPFSELRDRAAAAPGPLRAPASGADGVATTTAAGQPVRGFVRRSVRSGLPTTGDRAETPGDDGEFTVNFENAELREVLRAFLDDGLGANYAVDPAVEGTVTISTNRPLTRAQLLPTLEEILRLNDAAIVDTGDLLQILPRQQAGLAAPVVSSRRAAAQGLTVRVTPLRYVGVDDVRDVLGRFEPVAGAISYDPRRALVFSIGTAAEQRTIAELIRMLDVGAMAGRSFALQPLRYSEPEDVAAEMAEIFAGPGSTRVRFVPVQRLGAVLIITESPGLIDEAMGLMASLDQIGAETPQMHVFPVENRDAADVAVTLGGLLGVTIATAPQAQLGLLGPGLTASRAGAGDAEDAGLAAAAQDSGGPAAETAPSGGVDGVVRMAVDDNANAIVALATAAGARRVQAALRRLDSQPLQLVVEATIAEVVLNDDLEFGVRWFLESGNFAATFSDAASGAAGAVFPGFNALFQTANTRATLSALDAITDVRLLSSPTLMVLDNQVARLQVGDQVPVTTRSAQSVADPDAPIVTETEFRDTGVILAIRPRVNPNGLVTLTVRQEVSEVLDNNNVDNPTFSQRVVESTVAVDSGDTVAIGGLIRERTSRSRSGLPVLSNIPVVGGAFGVTQMGAARTELIVLLTPMIVRDQRDARAATAELQRRLDGVFGPPPTVDPITGPRRRAVAPWAASP